MRRIIVRKRTVKQRIFATKRPTDFEDKWEKFLWRVPFLLPVLYQTLANKETTTVSEVEGVFLVDIKPSQWTLFWTTPAVLNQLTKLWFEMYGEQRLFVLSEVK